MKNYTKAVQGTNQYKIKYGKKGGKSKPTSTFVKYVRFFFVWFILMAIMALAWNYEYGEQPPLLSPVGDKGADVVFAQEEIKIRILTEAESKEAVRKAIPNMVELSAERFTTNTKQKNFIVYQLFCLLREESNLGENESCGDNGKSCGVLQFREATYNRMRREMIRKGLVTELGDRFSPAYSIETTAYALVQGYGNEWGPISRGKCK